MTLQIKLVTTFKFDCGVKGLMQPLRPSFDGRTMTKNTKTFNVLRASGLKNCILANLGDTSIVGLSVISLLLYFRKLHIQITHSDTGSLTILSCSAIHKSIILNSETHDAILEDRRRLTQKLAQSHCHKIDTHTPRM